MDDPNHVRGETRHPRQYRCLNECAGQSERNATSTGAFDEFTPAPISPPGVPVDVLSRRRFLSLLSASASLALGASACSSIDRGSIVPYTKRPDEVIPGVANYYASTFQEGLVTQSVLVKTREGRPIHVEGILEDALSGGKASLRCAADLLGLYDPDRLRRPSRGGTAAAWEESDREIVRALRGSRDDGSPVLLLTDAVVSPTRSALIQDLKKALPALRHAAWEPAAPHAGILAAQALYGEAALPRMRLDRADVIAAFEADFLGSQGDAAAMIRDFAARRRVSGPADTMNRLWVFEGRMSLTGANADHHIPMRPSRCAALMFALAGHLHRVLGVALPPGLTAESLEPFALGAVAADSGIEQALLSSLCDDLKRAGRSALVMAGPALTQEAHVACRLLNLMLGAEGHTADASMALPVPDLLTYAGLRELLEEAAGGRFAAAVFWGANPAYSFPQASAWKSAVAKIPLKIRIGLHEDETALDCDWRLPEHHWLEAWGDFAPAADVLSLRQPAMGAIHDTRQGEDILLSWLRALEEGASLTYLDYLKARWENDVYPAGSPAPFPAYWNAALHNGGITREAKPRTARAPGAEALGDAVRRAAAALKVEPASFELVLHPGAAVYDGRYANNGWLNELPDPVTKATWCNPLLLSVSDAARLQVNDGDLVRITAGSGSVEVPVIVQPGQAPHVASLALGYGRRTGTVAAAIGTNAYVLAEPMAPAPLLCGLSGIERTGGRRPVPRTQEHFRMEGRDLARSWTRSEYSLGTGVGSAEKGHELASLIPPQQFPGHKWGMAIDLSACVGCSACVAACQSENNIPVVGPERVREGREMHWIRVDRYYEGDPGNPTVIHMPIPCQHCDNAPCEIVCPVNATTHSPDGLNQMTYNRCVGTRYCSNNCPYKVRRFNFFEYTSMKQQPENLVFNPEVTVRPRGVMEKCTFCIQRIDDARQRANSEGRGVRDGEINPACAVACPAQAIVFGDMNDPRSRVAMVSRMNRGYHLLEELGVKPSVTYLADISNPVSGKGQA